AAESIAYDKQFESDTLSFFVHDMREIFRVNYFDYVFNLFTSFGYFDKRADNERTIQAHAAALKNGGIFVLDYFNADKVTGCLVPHEEKLKEGILFRISKEIKGDCIVKTIDFSHGGKDFHFREQLMI